MITITPVTLIIIIIIIINNTTLILLDLQEEALVSLSPPKQPPDEVPVQVGDLPDKHLKQTTVTPLHHQIVVLQEGTVVVAVDFMETTTISFPHLPFDLQQVVLVIFTRKKKKVLVAVKMVEVAVDS